MLPTATRRRLERVAVRLGPTQTSEVVEEGGYSEQTATNYRIAAVRFIRWLDAGNGALPASPETVLEYLGTLGDLAYNTCRFRVRAIGALHRQSGVPDPTADPRVRAALKAIRTGMDAPETTPPRGARRAVPAVSASLAAAESLIAAAPEFDAPQRLQETALAAGRLATKALKPRTGRNYAILFARFSRWCAERGEPEIPATAETVRAYLASRSDLSYGTIRNDASAISWAHQVNGCTDPTKNPEVRELLRLAKKAWKPKVALPIAPSEIRALLATLGDAPLDRRDAAYVLVKLAGCLNFEQIADIDRSGVVFTDDGVVLRRSADEAFAIGIGADPATCPVRALERWLDVIGDDPGPLFPPLGVRGGFASVPMGAIAGRRLVRRMAVAAGVDPSRFSIFGIKRGFIRAAAAADVPASHIMAHTRLTLSSVLKHTGQIGKPYELAVATRRARRARKARRIP